MSYKKVISLETTDVKDSKQITQQIIGTSIHSVLTQYRILSKNDFGLHKNRINLGLFNKKTSFKISEKESIMAINKKLMKLESPNIEDLITNPENYFLIWKYSFPKRNNDYLELVDKYSNTTYNINLNYNFAKKITKYILNEEVTLDDFEMQEKLFIDNFIDDNNQKITFNKYILINSNYKFLLGFMDLFKINGIIPKNINLYSVSLIFNILEGSYSIRKKNNDFIIRYKFSPYLYKLLILNNEMTILEDLKYKFRNLKYFVQNNNLVSKYLKYFNKIEDIKIMENNLDSIGINSGEIELIPCTDLVFEKIEISENNLYNRQMIDLVMENDNAHNFFLDGLPLLKNSDGDILAAMAIFSKEAAKEADLNFSASAKNRFVNPANMNIQNWAVKTDSQLGLYNATK